MELVHGFGNNNKEETLIYPVRSVYEVLGTLAKFPKLFNAKHFDICEGDFLQEGHKLAFNILQSILCKDHSIKTISAIDMDNYISQHGNEENKQLWEQQLLFSYMQKSIEHCNKHSFKTHYWEIKKCTLVRTFAQSGVNLDEVMIFDDLRQQRLKAMNYEELETKLIALGKEHKEQLMPQLNRYVSNIDSQIELMLKERERAVGLFEKINK